MSEKSGYILMLLHLLSPLGLGFHVCVVRIAVGCEVVLFAVCFGLRGVEGRCEHLKVRRGRDAPRGKDAFEHDGIAWSQQVCQRKEGEAVGAQRRTDNARS